MENKDRRRVSGLLRAATTSFLCTLLVSPMAFAAQAEDIQRLVHDLDGQAEVRVHPVTGAARFVRLTPRGSSVLDALVPGGGAGTHEKASAFLARYAGMFGIDDPSTELTMVRESNDAQGGTHLTYAQRYRGVPVFGAQLKAHFDARAQLRVVNGTTVPAIDLDATPSRSPEEAGRVALTRVSEQKSGVDLTVRNSRLYVYRAGLVQGVPGTNHLVWEVEVGNGRDVRELVYVDAHTGKFVDQITGVYDALNRKAYQDFPNFPTNPFWTEGDPFPTSSPEADGLIASSGDIYELYFNAFGRDSYDGAGHTMHGIFDAHYDSCDAFFNGTYAAFCSGFTTDDIVGHEWTHGYTEFTDNLVYAWQSGALNEATSDIFGEVSDLINGRGLDEPGGARGDGSCSAFSDVSRSHEVTLTLNAPAEIAGDYAARWAGFGPPPPSGGLTGDVVLANDGTGSGVPPAAASTDGCCGGTGGACAPGEWPNAAEVAGKIVLMDRGTCYLTVKVKNAQLQGAVGVIIANHSVGGPLFPGFFDSTLAIPWLFVDFGLGSSIKGELPNPGVSATLRPGPLSFDNSYRWLMGEDHTGGSSTSFRDLRTPTCFGQPGKVTDMEYQCFDIDYGGVHMNSGIPSHAFALLADGGTYNGYTVGALGLVKVAHIYFRAKTVYQTPLTSFGDHADALEQSCQDLIGVDLTALQGGSSGEVLTTADCDQVTNAALAVELRTLPTQCGTVLAKDPPDRCEAGTVQANVFSDDFETNPVDRWRISHKTTSPTFTPRDWTWVSDLPDREGSGMFAPDPNSRTCDSDTDESGVLFLFSPVLSLPPGAANPRLTFDHWVGTELGWDGGNLKISRNGGPWQLVAAADYTYNSFNYSIYPRPFYRNTDPMAGEPAFSGGDGGQVSGSWGRSHVNLAPYAAPGDTVQLRFDLGSDVCFGLFGWYLDDPTVYACVPSELPQISIDDVQLTEGKSGLKPAVFTVSLSHASAQPVTISYETVAGTASELVDFIPAAGSMTIPALELTGTITIDVVGDRARESDETFSVSLVGASGGAILDGNGAGTILNDDRR